MNRICIGTRTTSAVGALPRRRTPAFAELAGFYCIAFIFQQLFDFAGNPEPEINLANFNVAVVKQSLLLVPYVRSPRVGQ